jgi:hypothetical protein
MRSDPDRGGASAKRRRTIVSDDIRILILYDHLCDCRLWSLSATVDVSIRWVAALQFDLSHPIVGRERITYWEDEYECFLETMQNGPQRAEEPYSIWAMAQGTPPGWKEQGFQGTRHDCLECIDRI